MLNKKPESAVLIAKTFRSFLPEQFWLEKKNSFVVSPITVEQIFRLKQIRAMRSHLPSISFQHLNHTFFQRISIF